MNRADAVTAFSAALLPSTGSASQDDEVCGGA